MNDPSSGTFDRLDLIHLTDRYLAALVANDPSAVPLARSLRSVENLRQIKPGDGLWATASGRPGSFAIYVPDPQQQTAGFIGMLAADGAAQLDSKVFTYEIVLADGTTTMHAPAFDPFDLPAAHIFKVGPDRHIHEIEAMGFIAPYGSPSGW
jgi:hypothetical protein